MVRGSDFYPQCPKIMTSKNIAWAGGGGGIKYKILYIIVFQKTILGRTEQDARIRLTDVIPQQPSDTASDYGLLTSCDSVR